MAHLVKACTAVAFIGVVYVVMVHVLVTYMAMAYIAMAKAPDHTCHATTAVHKWCGL